MKRKRFIISILLLAGAFGAAYLAPYRVYAVVSDLTVKYSVATGSADLIVGYGKSIKTEHGPLNFSAKTGENTYSTGMVLMPSGNVGIGTTGPHNKLEIVGPGSDVDAINLNKGTGTGGIKFTFDGTNYVSYIRTFESGTLADNYMTFGLSTGTSTNTEIMRFKGNGNVGIGTTGPKAKFQVDSGSLLVSGGEAITTGAGAPIGVQLRYGTVANTTELMSFDWLNNAGKDLYLRGLNVNIRTGTYGDTSALYVNSNGNVGIGDASPAYLLTVGSGDLFGVNSSGYALLPAGAVGTPSLSFTADTNTGLWSSGADTLNLSTGGSERVRIDSSGNVGIGTTGPTAKLQVEGSGTGGISLNVTNDLFVNDSSGNVGIGTTGPGSKLEVAGDLSVATNKVKFGTAGSENYGLSKQSGYYSATGFLATQSTTVNGRSDFAVIPNGTSNVSNIWLYRTSDITTNVEGAVFGTDVNGITGSFGFQSLALGTGTLRPIVFVVGSTEAVRISNTGNVGIGTTSPLTTLDVAGSASISGTLTVGNGGTIRPQYGPLTLAYKSDLNSWTTGITLQDTTGSVGIGTTSPVGKLHVTGAVTGKALAMLNETGNQAIFTASASGTPVFNITSAGAYTDAIYGRSSSTNKIDLYDNGLSISSYQSIVIGLDALNGETAEDFSIVSNAGTKQLFYISTAGDVGIGTSVPGAKLDVRGGNLDLTTGNFRDLDLVGGGTTGASINNSGGIIRTTSDARLKTDITPLENALQKVLGLRGVNFNWIDTAQFGSLREIGFIAQEVEGVVPEVVRKSNDALQLRSVKTDGIVALTVEAIKEQQKKLLELEEKIRYQQEVIDRLERAAESPKQ